MSDDRGRGVAVCLDATSHPEFTSPTTAVSGTGVIGPDERQVVEGTQVLAQTIVSVGKRFAEKSVRSAYAAFARAVVVGPPVELTVDVVSEGLSTATAVSFTNPSAGMGESSTPTRALR